MKDILGKNLLILSLAFLLLAFFLSQNITKPIVIVSKQNIAWNVDSEKLLKFHLGFKRLQSSILWIATILESDIEHYRNDDLNSWMFLRFKTMSLLEPRFYETYGFGGVYLSVIKDDLEGATYIFNKGLNLFPNDFYLLRDASYHFYLEAHDDKRAYEISQRLKKLYPERKYLTGMITKLEAEYGYLENALISLNSYQLEHPRGTIIGDKIYEGRYALKAEIDLNCLNSSNKKIKCDKLDLDQTPYIFINGSYRSQKKWNPYRKKHKKK